MIFARQIQPREEKKNVTTALLLLEKVRKQQLVCVCACAYMYEQSWNTSDEVSKTLFPQWVAQSQLDLLHAWEQDIGKAKIHFVHNWESRHSIVNISGQSGTGDKATGSGRTRMVQRIWKLLFHLLKTGKSQTLEGRASLSDETQTFSF